MPASRAARDDPRGALVARLRLRHGGLLRARQPRSRRDRQGRGQRLVQPVQQPAGAVLAEGPARRSASCVANYLCALAGLTSTSRMIFAFARDGGLPGSVDLADRQPDLPHAGCRRSGWARCWRSRRRSMRRPSPRWRRVARCSSTSPTPCRSRPACWPKARRWTRVRAVPSRRLVEAVRGDHHHRRADPDVCRHPAALRHPDQLRDRPDRAVARAVVRHRIAAASRARRSAPRSPSARWRSPRPRPPSGKRPEHSSPA